MILRITLAALHLIALGIGLGAVIQRGTALRESPTVASLRRAFRADALWGIAALLWIVTGFWRLFAETEKPILFYMRNVAFHTKMGLLLVILALEIWPMITLMRWRRAAARGEAPEALVDSGTARRIATISHVQALAVVVMVVAATIMARAMGVR